MRNLILAGAVAAALAMAGAASAGPLKPSPITPTAAGEGNMPIGIPGCLPGCVSQDGTGGGPRVDWIVMANPLADGTANNGDEFLYLYQLESTSGALATAGEAGFLSRFTLSSGSLAKLTFTAMGVGTLAGGAADDIAGDTGQDLDAANAKVDLYGFKVPTGGTKAVTSPPLTLFGTVANLGHSGTDNGGTFANLNTLNTATGDKELGGGPQSALPLVCCDIPVRLSGSATVLSWDFDPLLRNGDPSPEESTILWALGFSPFYGGGAAIDGNPFSPWSTGHPGGLDIPVSRVPEPASLLLLGTGLLGLGFWGLRRRQS